jgi:hypothetical protein
MTPAEPPESIEPAAPPESPPTQPAASEQYALFLHYRTQGRARRERRRRQLRIAVGALVVGVWLITAMLFWTRHQRTPMTARVTEPPAAPAWQNAGPQAPPPDVSSPPKGRVAVTTEPPSPPAPTPAPKAPVQPPASSAPAPSRPAAPAPPPASTPAPPPAPSVAAAPSPAPAASVSAVRYQPRERLTTVRAGDAKEAVFELFATAFERRNGSVVRVEGMRLRASGRSAQHARVEVAEVKIADAATGSLYWFLFGDGHLVAWGRPEEWARTTGRLQVEIDYQPDPASSGRRSAEHS